MIADEAEGMGFLVDGDAVIGLVRRRTAPTDKWDVEGH